MLKTILIALLWLVPLSCFAECPVTYSYGRSLGEVAAHDPNVQFYNFDGSTAKRFIDAINSMPPESHWNGTHFMVIRRPATDEVQIAIADDKCLLWVTIIPEKNMAHF